MCVYLENKTEQDSNIVEEISACNYFLFTVNALCLVFRLCIVIQGESLKRILTLS